MAPGIRSDAAAREHQRLLCELYGTSPDQMLIDLQQALQGARLRVHTIDPEAPGSAASLDRLAEHLDGCRRQALKLAQRVRANQA
jgi:hypothetical protein